MLLEKMVLIDFLFWKLPQIFNCESSIGTSSQWSVVRVYTSTAEGTGFIPGQRLKDAAIKIEDSMCSN